MMGCNAWSIRRHSVTAASATWLVSVSFNQVLNGAGLRPPCWLSIGLGYEPIVGVVRFVYTAKAEARFRWLNVSTAESAVCSPVNL